MDGLRLVVETGAVVRGVVRTAGGEPVAGARVFAGTDAAGRFSLPRISAGRYRLVVRSDGHAPLESEVEVRGGASLHLELELAPEPAAAAPQPPAG